MVMAINLTRGFNGVLMLPLIGLSISAWAGRRSARAAESDPSRNPHAWPILDIWLEEFHRALVRSTVADTLRERPKRNAPVLVGTAAAGSEPSVSAYSRMEMCQKSLDAQPATQHVERDRQSKSAHILSEKWQ